MKRIISVILVLSCVITPVGGAFTLSQQDVPEYYMDILLEYKDALENDFYSGDYSKMPNVNPELVLAGSGVDKLYYALEDLSGDGTPELFISRDVTSFYNIYDIYGYANGTVQRLFDISSMGYRAIYAICENGVIHRAGYSGAYSSNNDYYSLGADSAAPALIEGIEYNGLDGDKYWRYTVENGSKTQISKAQAGAINDSYNTAAITWNDIEDLQPGSALPYKDVLTNAWYFDAVVFVTDCGLMNGVNGTQFAPSGTLTRAMVATVLYRMQGEPNVTHEDVFTDVPDGQWYSAAVIWASDNGIVNGYGNGRFGTTDNITREQLATMLYRYANGSWQLPTSQDHLTQFRDAGTISSWACDAMSWAVDQRLITGSTTTTLDPGGTANRAQCATILMRFMENGI